MELFPQSIFSDLEFYVYLYIDPRNNEIFYVGKGQRNSCFDHLTDTKESEKVKRINDLNEIGLTPKIEILIHGLSEEQSLNVEASVIDLLDVSKLTNIVKGHHSSQIGRMPVDKVLALYKREDANITEPSLLIKISKTFYYAMSPQELYDCTRQFWKLGDRRKSVKFAFAIFDGLIQEVYEVLGWYQAGTTFSTRKYDGSKGKRWEFVGNIAKDKIRSKYLYKNVSDITKYQSPIYYLNIDVSEEEKKVLEENEGN